MRILRLLLPLLALGLGNAANADIIVVDAFANSSSGGGTGADTGIDLVAGQHIDISVDPDDLWNAGPLPRWSNADGLVGDLFATGTDESGQAAGTLIGRNFGLWVQGNLSAPYGSLVGRIDNGDWFLIGTSFSGAAPDSGRLLLYYWDSNNFDNTQAIAVDINVRVPEPGSLALLGIGLLGIGLVRRRRIAN